MTDFKEYSELFHAAARRSSSKTISRPSAPGPSKMAGSDDAFLANSFIKVYEDRLTEAEKNSVSTKRLYKNVYNQVMNRPGEGGDFTFEDDNTRQKVKDFLSAYSSTVNKRR